MAERKRKKRPARGKAKQSAPPKPRTSNDVALDAAWRSSRAGARNVAGVRFQVLISVALLVEAAAGLRDIASIAPEGWDDVDCEHRDGSTTLVQIKERSPDQVLGPALIAAEIERAATRLPNPDGRFVLVSNAEIGSELRFSDWTTAEPETMPSISQAALEAACPNPLAKALVARTALVFRDWRVREDTISSLGDIFDVPRALAALIHDRLVADVSAVAHRQRGSSRHALIRRTPSDLEVLAREVIATVDPSHLDAAVRSGVVELLDFVHTSSDTRQSFLAGLDAGPAHIAADFDVPREDLLSEIEDALADGRVALIVGPSGSGKSAAMWRAAQRLSGRVRLARVLRLGRDEDVEQLIHHVELQSPSADYPLLICADDVGRPTMKGWENAGKRLLQLPGVLLLGAARQEDFQLSLGLGRARVVEPALSDKLAHTIAERLVEENVPLRLDAGEAFELSSGLLMEYISLLVAGQRLDDVVSVQVEARLGPEEETERELLRYVATAHILGLAIPTEAVRALVPNPSAVPAALHRLRDEHLLLAETAQGWIGLHERRSEVISRRLHELPPPTQAETFAELLAHVRGDEQPHLVVRAALHLGDVDSLTPVVEAAIAIMTRERADAALVARLLDSLRDADAAIHAAACLAVARERRLPSLGLSDALMLASHCRYRHELSPGEDEEDFYGNHLPLVQELALALPERPSSVWEAACRELNADRVVAMATAATAVDAVALLEAAYGGLRLNREAVLAIAAAHTSAPVALRSRIVLALATIAELPQTEFALCFGSLESRVEHLVAECELVVHWSLEEAEDGLVVSLRTLAPPEGDAHGAAVELCAIARALLPETDIVEVQTVTLIGEPLRTPPMGEDGERRELAYKRIPRANLPSEVETRRYRRLLDFVARLLAARYWTDRLRMQAEVMADLDELLVSMAEFLASVHPNARRVREWESRLGHVSERVNGLPLLPGESKDRLTPDAASAPAERLTMAMSLYARALSETDAGNSLLAPGMQLRESVALLRAARAEGYPSLASVGDPLPSSLEENARTIAGLMIASEEILATAGPSIRSQSRGRPWIEVARRLVPELEAAVLQAEEQALRTVLPTDGGAVLMCLAHEDSSGWTLSTDEWLIVVDGASEIDPPLDERLASLSEDMRSRLAFRTFVIITAGTRVVPIFGLKLGTGNFWPIDSAEVSALARRASLTILDAPLLKATQRVLSLALAASHMAAWGKLRQTNAKRMEASGLLDEARAEVSHVQNEALQQDLGSLLGVVHEEIHNSEPDSLFAHVEHATLAGVDDPVLNSLNSIQLFAVDAHLETEAEN